MQLHQLGDLIQDLRHEGYNLAQVHFKIDDVSYVLKSIDVTNGSVTIRLQAEPKRVVHEGFLGVGEKSSKSLEKT